jgi:hypothetical protein
VRQTATSSTLSTTRTETPNSRKPRAQGQRLRRQAEELMYRNRPPFSFVKAISWQEGIEGPTHQNAS